VRDASATPQQRLDTVLETCRVGNAHFRKPPAYLFILDKSWSMDGAEWGMLCAATKATIVDLQQKQPTAFVMIVLFGGRNSSLDSAQETYAAMETEMAALLPSQRTARVTSPPVKLAVVDWSGTLGAFGHWFFRICRLNALLY
jgi:hypothetical protein